MADLLLDTDIFVDHLRGARRISPGDDTIAYSVVTRAELMAGRGTEEDQVTLLLAPFLELHVDRAVAERAGRLSRGSRLRLPDALIAATALEHDRTLVTRNIRDFEGVDGLRLGSLSDAEG